MVFEYSQKGLPHALMHMVEHVMRGGHFAAFCTFLAEVAHKDFIKMAATLSRTEADYNVSQDNMLKWVLWQTIFTAVIEHVSESTSDTDPPNHHPSTHDSGNDNNIGVEVQIKEECPLPYMDTWSGITDIAHARWQETFLSKRVRVTPKGFLSIMCRKLMMSASAPNRMKLRTELQWRCFGTLSETRMGLKRKFVGISRSPGRRDFVRIRTPAQNVADDGTITINDTCWAAQILMFVHVSGFTTESDSGIVLPEQCRNTEENTSSVRFALVRWLAAHPDAIIRDDKCHKLRPVCSPPFDINHALWTFAQEDHNIISERVVNINIMNYNGESMVQRLANAERERKAMYGLVDPQSFENLMNCTRINTDTDANTILETITIPF